jgi:hypothetical protein
MAGIPVAIALTDEPILTALPADAARVLDVVPVEEATVLSYPAEPPPRRRPYEPSPVLQVLLSPLWLCVLAIIGIIILFIAIRMSASRSNEPAPRPPPPGAAPRRPA